MRLRHSILPGNSGARAPRVLPDRAVGPPIGPGSRIVAETVLAASEMVAARGRAWIGAAGGLQALLFHEPACAVGARTGRPMTSPAVVSVARIDPDLARRSWDGVRRSIGCDAAGGASDDLRCLIAVFGHGPGVPGTIERVSSMTWTGRWAGPADEPS